MGVLLTVKNSDFSANAIAFAPPVSLGAEYWNYFNDATKIGRNLLIGKPAGTVVGSPVQGAGFITTTLASAYVLTGLQDQSEVTLLCVARVPPALAGSTAFKYMIGDYAGSGTQQGSNLYFAGAADSKPFVGVARNNGSTDQFIQTSITSPDNGATFAFYAARLGAAANRIDDKTHGLSATGSVANPRSSPATSSYRIGSASGAPAGGQTDIAFAGIYSRVLTDAEVDAIYQRVKTYLASKSIAV